RQPAVRNILPACAAFVFAVRPDTGKCLRSLSFTFRSSFAMMSLLTFPSRSPLQLSLRLAFFAGAGAPLVLLSGQAQAQQSEQDAVLPAVQVVGEQETATGPVAGYRASRSATATKTDTPLAETPQSVTVVTRDQIVDQGATNLQDALNYAAGVRSDAY